MFCTSCGSQVAAQQAYCPNCGKPMAPLIATVPGRSLGWHLNLLAILWFIVAALCFIPAGVLLAIGAGAGIALHSAPDAGPFAFAGPLFFYCLGSFIFIIALVNFFCAWGLHKVRPWGRTLAIVMGVLSLFNAPFGTALGVYTLIMLAPAENAREYERLSAQAEAAIA